MKRIEVHTQVIFKNTKLTAKKIEKLDTGITKIKFSYCMERPTVWAEVIIALSSRKSLRTVSFEKCDFSFKMRATRSTTREQQILCGLNNITSLVLKDCCLTQQEAKLLSKLVKLEELEISGNNIIERIDFLYQLVNLKKLSLSFQWIDESEMKYLLHFARLQSLTITNLKSSINSIKIMEKIKNITELDIIIRDYKPQYLRTIFEMTSLQRLSITDLWSQEQFEFIQNLQNMVCFHLKRSEISSESVKFLLGLPHLKQLKIQSCSINDEVCRQLSKIKTLVKLGIEKMRNKGLGQIGIIFFSQLTNLQQLTLCTKNLRLSSISALTGLKNLRVLNLDNYIVGQNAQKIGDSHAKIISKMHSLELLSIPDGKIGAEGVKALSHGLINLKILLIDLHSFGNEGIFELRKFTQLKIVELGYCQFNANGMLFIQRMNNLDKLGLGKLKMTAKVRAYEKIQRRLPNLCDMSYE